MNYSWIILQYIQPATKKNSWLNVPGDLEEGGLYGSGQRQAKKYEVTPGRH